MNTSTSARAAARKAAAPQTADTVADRSGTADFARQQLASGAEAAAVLYRAAEAVQQINLQLVQRAALRQQQLAEKLRTITNPAEVMSLETSLLSVGMQEATQYLQELAAATMAMQSELMRGAGSNGKADTQPETGIPVSPIAPVWQAWQTMFTTPLNGAAVSH
jgi:hypothetical protein